MFLTVSAALPETTSLLYTKNSAYGAVPIKTMLMPAINANLPREISDAGFVIFIEFVVSLCSEFLSEKSGLLI